MAHRQYLNMVIKGDGNVALVQCRDRGIDQVRIRTSLDNSRVVEAPAQFIEKARDWFHEAGPMPEGGYPPGTLLFWSIKEE